METTALMKFLKFTDFIIFQQKIWLHQRVYNPLGYTWLVFMKYNRHPPTSARRLFIFVKYLPFWKGLPNQKRNFSRVIKSFNLNSLGFATDTIITNRLVLEVERFNIKLQLLKNTQ